MKHLKIFSLESDYYSYRNSDSFIAPNISLVESVGIFYNPQICNIITYTSSTNDIIIPSETSGFGANLISNSYENGVGIMMFDGNITNIPSRAFLNCTSLTGVVIPEGVTSIGQGAFQDCTQLTRITFGNGITSIDQSAFSGCSGLKEVHINDIAAWCNIDFGGGVAANPLQYARNLYLNNELITELVIPNGVTSIGNQAFSYCSRLTSIEIPNSVTSIGEYAFSGCSGLKSITCVAITPPSLSTYTFNSVSKNIPVYVPQDSINTYKEASGWKAFTNIQQIQ